MFGLKPMEMIFIVGVLVVMASAVIGVVYIAVRLALRSMIERIQTEAPLSTNHF